MKNSKGVTLITLTVMIVVMLILASIAMNAGMFSVKEANETKIAVEIEKLKEAVAKRMTDNARNESAYPLVGKKPNISEDLADGISKMMYAIKNMSNEEKRKFIETINYESIDYIRIINREDAANLGVYSIVEDHYFIVDYYNGNVYGVIDPKVYNSLESNT